jgi:hypothetical protein
MTTPQDVFYNDVQPGVADTAAARLQPQTYAAVTDRLTAAAWQAVPSTYVICDRDNAIPVFAQEAMSQRATHVEHLPAGHSPFLSQQDGLIQIVSTASREPSA